MFENENVRNAYFFLPRTLYPFACFRLVCERLYGQAACMVRYSPSVPASEFNDVDADMVVTKVTQHIP